MDIAKRLRREGVRVLLLTSTDQGPAVFPSVPALDPEPLLRIARTNRMVVNSIRARDFATQPRAKEFALYSLRVEP
jgi:hypothetical protein